MGKRSNYAQDKLFNRKAEFWLLELDKKKTGKQKAQILGVSRSTYYVFRNSQRYKEFKLALEGDKLLDYISRECSKVPHEDIQNTNALTTEQIREQIRGRYPFLSFE